MSPAKVTTSQGKIFFVPEGEEIAEKGREKFFPEEALDQLVYTEIHGTRNGFKTVDVKSEVDKEYYTQVSVRSGSPRGPVIMNKAPVIELKDGSRIEPITTVEMEWHNNDTERR